MGSAQAPSAAAAAAANLQQQSVLVIFVTFVNATGRNTQSLNPCIHKLFKKNTINFCCC